MITAYKHQQDIINDDPKHTGLFLGTGAGKSFIALSLAEGKTLVICPKTLKEDKTWERQLSKMSKDIFLTVMSKEIFKRDAHNLPPFDTVIVDEAHTCLGVTANVRWVNKEPRPKTSQIFEALDEFISRIKPKRLYLCTATVIRSPMTVWGAAKILGKNWDWYKFRNIYYARLPMPGREVFVAKSDSATKDRLASTVRKLGYTGQLSDYFDVPDQTHQTVYVDLTVAQKARIKALPLEFPDPLVLLGKTHQVENGVLAGDDWNAEESFPNAKMEKISDYAIEFPRMIIFAKYRSQIDQVAKTLSETGKKVFILTGDTKDRGRVIGEANKCDDYVFIAQSQISAGFEIPNCPVMVFASLDWSVVNYLQAQGRILRANSLKKNLYINLVAKGGIDEHVYKTIMNKEDFNARIYLNL